MRLILVCTMLRRSLVAVLLLAVTACTARPSEEECLRSLENFFRISTGGILSEAEVQRMVQEQDRDLTAVCREKKSREQVLCEIEATNLAELKACGAQ